LICWAASTADPGRLADGLRVAGQLLDRFDRPHVLAVADAEPRAADTFDALDSLYPSFGGCYIADESSALECAALLSATFRESGGHGIVQAADWCGACWRCEHYRHTKVGARALMAAEPTEAGSMAGRVCLVTGATSGLGLATAHALIRRGATVVVAGRSPAACRAAVADIGRGTGRAGVDWVAADLSVQDDVRTMADELRHRYARLHVLINNAGAVFQRRRLSLDGVEMTLAVNHLAPFLLTAELFDTLRASAPARVITVSSVAHERERLDFDDLQLRRGYRPFRAYARSKLANVLFTCELARRLEDTGVTANTLTPGLVRTDLGAKDGWVVRVGWRLILWRHRRVAVDPDQAARAIVHLACSPELEDVSGRYFDDNAEARSSPASDDRAAAAQLWALSEELTSASRDDRSGRRAATGSRARSP
jgi:NAD(P)-dependent dehydrogenase (short-subunit alcohol dehydrogenase family)